MRNIILFLITSVTLLILIYLSLQTKNQTNQSIRIGINQWPGYEYLFLAKKQGYFKQQGLNVELVELSSLAEVRRAFERGKIDGMATTLVEILEAYKYSGRIAQIVLVTDYSKGADLIFSLSEINSIKELKGKKIGIEAGSLSSYMVNRALLLNDIEPSEVIFVPLEHHEMAAKLISRKVHAITSYPPTSISIKKQYDVNSLFDSSEIPKEIIDIIAIDRDILVNQPLLANKIRKVWANTLRFVHTNPHEAYDTLVERFPITIDEFKEIMQFIELVPAENQETLLKPEGEIVKTLNKLGEMVLPNDQKKNINYTQFIYH